MIDRYLRFIRQISINWLGRIGVILTTSSFITFIFLEILRLGGILTNAYIGLITYLTFPTLFIIGLLLIPVAWWRQRRKEKRPWKDLLARRFGENEIEPRPVGSRLFAMIGLLTGINVLFMAGASFRTLHFMDTAEFCGTACHGVMNPEWTTYQVSPHARVKCVECHVGEGVDALIDSKLNGARQMLLFNLDSYDKPIHTPVKQLRPARETCEKCHWPEKFYGERMDIFTRYDRDFDSSPRYSTLNLKIDTGKVANRAGIHWHIGKQNKVRYTSIDDERRTMIRVESLQPDGSYRQFSNRRETAAADSGQEFRVMDCVDCHNRATHIYEEPEDALDHRMSLGQIDRTLPFIKREVLRALTLNYADDSAAQAGIRNHLTGFYQREYPDIASSRAAAIDEAIDVAQGIYSRNVHHYMKVEWHTYPAFIHHHRETGCFRCHNENLADQDGRIISYDCTLCHSILAYESKQPFAYLETPDTRSPEYPMHKELRDEFMSHTY